MGHDTSRSIFASCRAGWQGSIGILYRFNGKVVERIMRPLQELFILPLNGKWRAFMWVTGVLRVSQLVPQQEDPDNATGSVLERFPLTALAPGATIKITEREC